MDGVYYVSLQVEAAGDTWERKQIGLGNLQKVLHFSKPSSLSSLLCVIPK